jgi:peptidoglycan/LPS O-acetylase OafA/YrhL
MASTSNFRPDINALRALAVSLVVLFHFKIRGFSGGFVGVDIFFVISGYLMTKIVVTDLRADTFSYWRFLSQRVVRIWPALMVLVIVMLAVGAVWLAPFDYESLGKQASEALFFKSNAYFQSGDGYFASASEERWLLHTWSLSVEWQFYMLYPLVLWVAWRIASAFRRATPSTSAPELAVVTAVIALVAVSLAVSVVKTQREASWAFFLLPARAWEMAAGGMLLLAEPRLKEGARRYAKAFRAAAFGIVVFILFSSSRQPWELQWPGALALWPVAAAVLFLLPGSAGAAMPKWMSFAPIQKVGLWSYSIYLWHWPIVVAMNMADLGPDTRRYAKLVGIALSFLLGWASYRWVESRFKYKRQSGPLQPALAGAALGTAGSLVLALAVVGSEGWLARAGADAPYLQRVASMRLEKSIPDRCGNYKLKPEDMTICSINANLPGKRVLVYGDSHAGHLYPYFEREAKVRVDFLVSNGCPPAKGYNRMGVGYLCSDFTSYALRLAATGPYDTVVAAGNWNAMDQSPSALCSVANGDCPREVGAPRAELIKANRDEWQKLLAMGKQVVLVAEDPFAPFDVPKTTMRRIFRGDAPIREFQEFVAYNRTSSTPYIDEIYSQLSDNPGLHRISLRTKFCEGLQCKVFDPDTGLPVLNDNNHYAPEWMRRHGTDFLPFIQPKSVATLP